MELVPAADLTKEGRLDGRLNPSSSSLNYPGRKSCHLKIKEIEDEWEKSRPRTAEYAPKDALDLLNIIGKKI